MTDRILRNTAALLSVSLFEAESAADVDDLTVTVTNDAGAVVASGAAAGDGGVYSFALDPLADLDRLTVDWSYTLDSNTETVTTFVEIVGGYLFQLSELRAMDSLSNTAKYPTDRLLTVRTQVETLFERACRRAFVPRYGRATVTGNGTTLWLPRPQVRRIIGATVDGDPVDTSGWAPHDDGSVTLPESSSRTFDVRFEHGLRFPPADVHAAGLQYARYLCVSASDKVNDRTISQSADGVFSQMAVAGFNRPTGLPSVDAVLLDYRRPRPSAVGGWS